MYGTPWDLAKSAEYLYEYPNGWGTYAWAIGKLVARFWKY
jgi:hypothetical protein